MGSRRRQARKRTDRERLELFLKLVSEFNQSKEAKNGLRCNLSYSWSRSDGQLVVKLEQPDEQDLRLMLMTLRKFVSEGTDVYVQSIHGIVFKSVARGDEKIILDEIRASLARMNEIWRKEFESGFARLNVNGQEISPKSAMNLWLNGKYFHDDPDYAEMLDRLDRVDPKAAIMIRWQFLNAVLATTQYVDWLAGNVDYLLTNNMLDFEALSPSTPTTTVAGSSDNS